MEGKIKRGSHEGMADTIVQLISAGASVVMERLDSIPPERTMSRQTLSVRAPRAASFARSTLETMSDIERSTTLRFSRRSGESMRDADYAAAIECPAGQPLVLLDPEEGLVPFLLRILDCLRRLASKP